MTSLYILVQNQANRWPKNTDVSFHFVKKQFLRKTAMTNIQGA